ncbi:MAG: aminodeoxychorismate synthase component I [Flavobacteriaceae bacterium]
MKKEKFIRKINKYTANGTPYLFVMDFELQKPFVCKISNLEKNNVFYSIKGVGNLEQSKSEKNIFIKPKPLNKKNYKIGFDTVKSEILKGNSYLLNLTFPTKIKTKNSLSEIIYQAKADYKLFFKNKFISFSPESFIQIKDNKIYTFPMKGTIDALIPDAKKTLLDDKKETYEHNTIVDLMRNDLAMVSTDIKVNRFRYVETIKTSKGAILQVSSEIEGTLPKNWKDTFGEILYKLLPAGSISGAPKPKTLEIIRHAEQGKRGFYTGVFGVFDGSSVDSAVLIRYIEKKKQKLIYRSGGGITSKSNLDFEYDEMLQKIYIPK